ncbi:MAG: succinylglutamate desuccinylase/aspartoacylase family protein [Halioglobus sp.]|nr:succinylglutamate desuccinylase/aspartoacylase family protein [Halioglobus sp.]
MSSKILSLMKPMCLAAAVLSFAPILLAADPPDSEIRLAMADETGGTEARSETDTDTATGVAVRADAGDNVTPVPNLPSPVVDASDRLVPVVPLANAVTTAEHAAETLHMLGAEVPPGSSRRLAWAATELFEGVPVSTPVLVVNGQHAGPTLCVTAAVHGDELNGIEMVRRVMHDLNPDNLAGAVIGVPIVNLQGFRRGSRYLPDRRDLNRYFPGNRNGSAASRIAHSFFTEIVLHCDALIDLHTGSFERTNLPQLRADLRNPDVVTITQGFGATVILHSTPANGTLRHAATAAGVPTVTLEAGGPSELELKEVKHGVKGIETLLHTLGMVKRSRLWGDPEPVYYRSSWVRANRGGILLADVSLGSSVRRGDLLGSITDPMNNATTNLYSPFSGRIIGMAKNQVVMPGFAAFHVGIATDQSAPLDASRSGPARHDEAGVDDGYIDGISE